VFEVGILSNCTNLLVTMIAERGECDMYLNLGAPAVPGSAFVSLARR
jgi:hypothetical protein